MKEIICSEIERKLFAKDLENMLPTNWGIKKDERLNGWGYFEIYGFWLGKKIKKKAKEKRMIKFELVPIPLKSIFGKYEWVYYHYFDDAECEYDDVMHELYIPNSTDDKIIVNNRDMYHKAKAFGDKYGIKTLVKCWPELLNDEDDRGH